MRPVLNDELRVRHVLDAISEVESYLKGVSLEAYKGEVSGCRMEKHHRLSEYFHS